MFPKHRDLKFPLPSDKVETKFGPGKWLGSSKPRTKYREGGAPTEFYSMSAKDRRNHESLLISANDSMKKLLNLQEKLNYRMEAMQTQLDGISIGQREIKSNQKEIIRDLEGLKVKKRAPRKAAEAGTAAKRAPVKRKQKVEDLEEVVKVIKAVEAVEAVKAKKK